MDTKNGNQPQKTQSQEKKAIADDIKEIFAEARGTGFDVKIMKRVIAFRKMEKADFQEYDAMLDLYMEAVGFDHTPLGKVTTPAPKAAKAPLPDHDPATGEIIEKFAAHIAVQKEVAGLGKSVELTDEEKEKGVVAAFVSKDGARCSIGTASGPELPSFLDRRPHPPPQPAA